MVNRDYIAIIEINSWKSSYLHTRMIAQNQTTSKFKCVEHSVFYCHIFSVIVQRFYEISRSESFLNQAFLKSPSKYKNKSII